MTFPFYTISFLIILCSGEHYEKGEGMKALSRFQYEAISYLLAFRLREWLFELFRRLPHFQIRFAMF